MVSVGFESVDDHKTLVDSFDNVPGFLNDKLSAGANVSFTVINVDGDEQIVISAVVPPGTSDHKVLVDGSDTTAGFLAAKLAAGTNVSLVVLNPGGNEQVQITVSSASPSGSAGGDLGGTYPNPTVVALEETGGSTRLTFGAIAAGSVLQRVGTSVVGTAGTLGAVLIHDGTQFQPITFGSFNINTNASQAPTVAQGSTFFVDATALTANRNIIPDTTGAAERQGITFIVTVPTSGGGFSYSLVADVTLALSQKMMVECVFKSGAWQIGEWKPYQGTL